MSLWLKTLESKETFFLFLLFRQDMRSTFFTMSMANGPKCTSVFLQSLPFMYTNKIRDRQVDTCIYSDLHGQTDIYLLLYK